MSSVDVTARGLVFEALGPADLPPVKRAGALDAAAEAVAQRTPAQDTGITASAARALATALGCLADLERWEIDTLAVEVDAERHRRAAQHKAGLATNGLAQDDPVLGPLRQILETIATLGTLDERAGVRQALGRIPLPLALIDSEPAPFSGRPPSPVSTAPPPRAAIVTSLDGSPLTAAHAVAPGRVHELELEARVLDWPEEAQELVLRFLSKWPRSAVEIPEVRLARPEDAVNGVRTVHGTGHLALHAAAADPTIPVRLVIEGELLAGETSNPLRLLGHRELSVRTFDSRNDVVTGAPALDERILGMLAELRDEGLAPHEQPPLGRFLGALARAGVRIVSEREFPADSSPSEREFQRELLKRVSMANELGGRVQEHVWQGGGPIDLAHDGVVAELKVEKSIPATIDGAAAYLAQATQYASAGQRQLSILVILDMTHKDAPPGVLANSVGWLQPSLHGLEDPAYPSRVAVVIINGNLPRPSDWSS